MSKKLTCLLLCAALLCVALSPCAAEDDALVMTSFYPVYILAQNVLAGVEGVTLKSMTAPSTGCLHDYQLLAGDVRALSEADALVICGAGMEGYLDSLTKQLADLTIVDCSLGIELLPDEHEGEMNAHIWLDAQNAAVMVENMGAGLASVLPTHAEQIMENAAVYASSLRALDAEIANALKDVQSRDIVTFHEAFPYFAKAYDLNVVAVVSVEADEALSPRALADVITAVRDAACPPLFTEPQFASDAARAIALETGAKMYALDPLVTGDGAMTAYFDVMRQNVVVLREALGVSE